MNELTPELKMAYFQTFLGTTEGRMVLANMYEQVYGEDFRDIEKAAQTLARIEMFQGILDSCGVTIAGTIEAMAVAAAQNQVTEETEDIDLHGE